MKKMLAFVTLGMAGVSCLPSSVIHGSGRESAGEFTISLAYSTLAVSNGITVELIHSETGRGTITADERALEHVSIVEEGGRVTVNYVPMVTVSSPVPTVVRLPQSSSLAKIEASSAARVTSTSRVLTIAPELAIDASSAAEVSLDVEVGELDIDLSSAARFTGNVVVSDLEADLSSASKCVIDGTADYVRIESSSASSVDAAGLRCRKADCGASSAGSIEIGVTDEINARASSGASVRYRGNPAIVSRNASSGGSVRQLNL